MSYIPIHVHTCWSLLDSTLLVSDLAKKAETLGLPAVCLTDHHNIKALVLFFREMKNRGIKPIVGCELNIFNEDSSGFYTATVLAKNKNGLKNIVKLVSLGNEPRNISLLGTPCVSFEEVRQFSGNLVCLIGDSRSELYCSIYDNPSLALRASNEENCRKLVRGNWEECFDSVLKKYSSVFSDTLIFCNKSSVPSISLFEKCVSHKTGGEYLPSQNIHYLNKEDRDLHRLILKSGLDLKRESCPLESYEDNKIFFTKESECHLPESISGGERTLQILDLIEDYDIQERPILPKFKVQGHAILNDHEYLVESCREGFKKNGLVKDLSGNDELKRLYSDRISYELGVFENAGISSYFLIVKDLIEFVHDKGLPADVRGSSSGCMASYLLGISSIDPMNPDPTLGYAQERELPFERFYNEGRNTDGNISLADIDIDVPPNFRDNLIGYAREKYGHDCVGHIITHSRFKARGAIKEVFRLLKPSSNYFDIANDITKHMVEESKIAEEILERQQDDPDYGILRWNVDNIESVGNYYETYKDAFDLAMKLEQIPKNESVHAAGIIIADQPLYNLFPMRYSSKLDQMIIDIEGSEIEYIGGVKFDILGLAALEKMYQIEEMINKSKSSSEFGIHV